MYRVKQYICCLGALVLVWAGLTGTAGAQMALGADLASLKQQFTAGQLEAALATAEQLLAADPSNSRAAQYKQLIETRLRARNALQAEAGVDVAAISDNAVAVVSFTNTGGNKDLDALSTGLAEMIATDLAQVPSLTLLERVQMQALAGEMALGQTGLLEEATCTRMGKLLGAARVVNGSFKSDDGATITLDAGLADVKNGGLTAVSAVSGKLEDLFKLEKDIVFGLIDKMGIALTDQVRQQIQVIPTENVLAYLAYSKGLEAEARGDFDAAGQFYSEAVKQDPGFSAAGQKANLLTAAPAPAPEQTDPAALTEEVYVTQDGTDQSLETQTTEPAPTTSTKESAPVTYTAGRATDLVSTGFMPEVSIAGTVGSGTDEGTQEPSSETGDLTQEPTTTNSFLTKDNYGGATKEVSFEIPIPDIN